MDTALYPLLFSGGFSPANSASLVLWCRFNKDIIVTGAGVSQWGDASKNDNHLLQGTDASRPSKEPDGSILFNGSDQSLKTAAFTLNQPETIYLLFKSVTWANNRYIADGEDNDSGILRQIGTTPQLAIFAGAALASNADLAVGTYGAASVVFNGTSSVLQINNGAPLEGDAGASNMGGFTLGSRASEAGNFSNVQVKEVVIYSVAHDAMQRTQVVNYLLGL